MRMAFPLTSSASAARQRRRLALVLGAALVMLLTGCRRQPGTCQHGGGDAWTSVCTALDDSELRDAVVLLGDAQGRQFTWQRGHAPDTVLALASASKWLASATFLQLVDDGVLALGDRPQDHLDWATNDPADPRSAITLAHLLSFTAGFDVRPLAGSCASDGSTDLQTCARRFYDEDHSFEPGTTYFYGPAHLHVAAAMAEAATGRPFAQLFRDAVAAPVGMSAAAGFHNPSASNPRVAGGAEASAEDYERFLLAMLRGELLAEQLDVMHRDWTPSADVHIEYSPAAEWGLDWHYGLGNWLECPDATWSSTCDELRVVSSPGAFGFHPWIDRERGVYGVVSRRDGLLRSPAAGSSLLMLDLRPAIYAALER